MNIDEPDTAPEQGVMVDEMQDLLVGGHARAWQVRQGAKHDLAPTQIAQGDLADDKGVRQNQARIQQRGKRMVAGSQVIDPDGSVDQDHAGDGRRRRGAFRLGSVPPRRASRRALSRSINALSASRTKLDFSFSSVNV